MEALITFLIRINVYLLVFFVGYFFLLRNQPAPSFKRFFILSSFLLSLFLAMLPVMTLVGTAEAGALPQGEAFALPELIVRAGEGSSHVAGWIAAPFESMAGLRFLVVVVSGMMVMYTLAGLARIGRLIRTSRTRKWGRMRLVLCGPDTSPFSFFRYVFVPGDMVGQDHFSGVMAHEQAHYQRGHSWDVLFMEWLRPLFWFHPAYYYLTQELRAQHEFEADMLACRRVPMTDYQATLLGYTITGKLIPLTNPFNVSLIKKRIMMMNQKTKKPNAMLWLKTLLLIPALALAVAVQSCQDQTREEAPAETTFTEVAVESDYHEDVIFTVVENPPAFPGGEEARVNFLQENLRYPAEARAAGAQGTVFVSFVVRSDGSIYNVRVLRGAGHNVEVDFDGDEEELKALRQAYDKLDQEAARVISTMPAWEPGTQRGEAVSVQFNMPIRFALN